MELFTQGIATRPLGDYLHQVPSLGVQDSVKPLLSSTVLGGSSEYWNIYLLHVFMPSFFVFSQQDSIVISFVQNQKLFTCFESQYSLPFPVFDIILENYACLWFSLYLLIYISHWLSLESGEEIIHVVASSAFWLSYTLSWCKEKTVMMK